MYKFEYSVHINRSLEDVFEYATDPAKRPHYQDAVESAEWVSDGPPGVGSTFKQVSKVFGRKTESVVEMTGWDPPRMSRGKTVSGSVQVEATSTFEAQGNGTLVTHVVEAKFGGLLRLFEGFIGRQLEKQVQANSVTMKALLEAAQGASC